MTQPTENIKARFGRTKPELSIVTYSALEPVLHVMQHGADKYGRWNWRKDPVDAQTYFNAMWRHLEEWGSGRNEDVDSGQHPLAHVIAGALIILDSIEQGILIDNRLRVSWYDEEGKPHEWEPALDPTAPADSPTESSPVPPSDQSESDTPWQPETLQPLSHSRPPFRP